MFFTTESTEINRENRRCRTNYEMHEKHEKDLDQPGRQAMSGNQEEAREPFTTNCTDFTNGSWEGQRTRRVRGQDWLRHGHTRSECAGANQS